MIYKSRALDFTFRKLEFDMIYNAYSNESPFKYYISILGGGGLRPCLSCFFRGGGVQILGKPAYIILAHSLISCTSLDCGIKNLFKSESNLFFEVNKLDKIDEPTVTIIGD